MSTILVTGGAGFIGSNFVHHVLASGDTRVVNLDLLTYAGNRESLAGLPDDRHVFVEGDICDGPLVRRLLDEHRPDAIVHFAAESHVDRSIDDPGAFIRTNVTGTQTLLDAALEYWQGGASDFRFVHVSTDEVYGTLGPDEPGFTETHRYAPNSPYAASKAAADHLARSWHRTYGLPVMITNCSNNYGPFQFPEKLIPLMLINALEGEKLPVYGDGQQHRDWLFVTDHCRAIERVLEDGEPGRVYNIGGNAEMANLDVVHLLCDLLDERVAAEQPRRELIEYVTDRPGHDRRYAIDATRIRDELGWEPSVDFAEGLAKTVDWYLENRDWWQRIRDGRYRSERLGVARVKS
ncbi:MULTISPECIES: dTDP-glucose 4,6-dehydratase [unclassified Wenzhouxiangella]|uniref:dTDP-glucose 4,6-dehydratase n=1 Tax=unclassified Wenzhouxiangella TaxID=2613841 RepID=UPI000E32B19D|nr:MULTISPECIES: dTDP-glucose 4,6-dehydratase [unclassified Wenzhouxiangella]RFF27838.1 dTDP-glucose 4,6-dehydratase [Wenzhouxiangella sp. 15181]RFP70317.1 dTDP-glucose 4,6-dehydratase [Wenzhouxiangella sp. 15190]